MNYDTVAAISTAQGEGGIGVIRISGDDALRIADKIFNSVSGKKVTEMKGYTASFGKISENGEDIDEAVALVLRRLTAIPVKMLLNFRATADFTLQKEFCVLFSMPAPFRLRQVNLQSEHS